VRPDLHGLLFDVGAGKIDIVVVYKGDRFTRSLLDFTSLVEALDRSGTCFVSITRSFSTTTCSLAVPRACGYPCTTGEGRGSDNCRTVRQPDHVDPSHG